MRSSWLAVLFVGIFCAYAMSEGVPTLMEQLKQLGKLFKSGAVTKEEFQLAKAALLAEDDEAEATPQAGVSQTGLEVHGASIATAAAAVIFALDQLARLLSLNRSQKITWFAGFLPCAAFIIALVLRNEDVPSFAGAAGAAWTAWADRVKRQPLDEALHLSGQWAARSLVACLCITPVKNMTKKFWLHPLRQTFGLMSFAYAAIHAVAYAYGELLLDRAEGDPMQLYPAFMKDMERRPYILLGIVSGVIMLVLAATSYASARKSMGKNWGRLHKLVYISAIAASIHVLQYQWKYPAMYITGSRVYPALVALLLAYRLYVAVAPTKAKAKAEANQAAKGAADADADADADAKAEEKKEDVGTAPATGRGKASWCETCGKLGATPAHIAACGELEQTTAPGDGSPRPVPSPRRLRQRPGRGQVEELEED